MNLLTIEETAEVLKISVRTARKWHRQGLIPGVKVAGKWRVDMDLLRETLRSRSLDNLRQTK